MEGTNSPDDRPLQRAWFLHQARREEQALVECARALARNPEFSEAHGLRAFCLLRLDRGEEALEAAREAVRNAPEWAWAHYVRGFVQRRCSLHDGAEASFQEAIRLDPEDATYREELAWNRVNTGRWLACLEACDEGCALAPEDAGLASLRGLALQRLSRFQESEEAYREALRLDPENVIAHGGMGYLALRRREGEKAAASFQEALRLDPDSDWVKSGLGDALRSAFPGYARILQFTKWVRGLTGWRKSLLTSAASVLFVLLLLMPSAFSLPYFHERLGRWAIVPLVASYLLPVAWAYTFWVLRPLCELGLSLHPVGRWLVRRDRVRKAIVLLAVLAAGVLCLLLGILLGSARSGVAGVVLLVAGPCIGAQLREPPPPRWGRADLLLAILVPLGCLPVAVNGIPILGLIALVVLYPFLVYTVYLSLTAP